MEDDPTSRNRERLGYSISEVAQSLSLSTGFVRLEVSRGHLVARKLGRRTVILADDLKRYLDECEVAVEESIDGR